MSRSANKLRHLGGFSLQLLLSQSMESGSEVDSMFAYDPGEHIQVAVVWELEGLIM